MDKSSITMTTGKEWWIERITMGGRHRYPERILVGSLENPRVYVTERTCHIKLDENRDIGEPPYFCDRCGTHFSDVYMFSWTGACRKFERCPNCGAKVMDE